MPTAMAIYTFIVANWSTIIFIFGTVASAIPVLRQVIGILGEYRKGQSLANEWELLKRAAHAVEEYYNANPELQKSVETTKKKALEYIQLRNPKFPVALVTSGLQSVLSAESMGATGKVIEATAVAIEVEKSIAVESAKRKFFAAPTSKEMSEAIGG